MGFYSILIERKLYTCLKMFPFLFYLKNGTLTIWAFSLSTFSWPDQSHERNIGQMTSSTSNAHRIRFRKTLKKIYLLIQITGSSEPHSTLPYHPAMRIAHTRQWSSLHRSCTFSYLQIVGSGTTLHFNSMYLSVSILCSIDSSLRWTWNTIGDDLLDAARNNTYNSTRYQSCY